MKLQIRHSKDEKISKTDKLFLPSKTLGDISVLRMRLGVIQKNDVTHIGEANGHIGKYLRKKMGSLKK